MIQIDVIRHILGVLMEYGTGEQHVFSVTETSSEDSLVITITVKKDEIIQDVVKDLEEFRQGKVLI